MKYNNAPATQVRTSPYVVYNVKSIGRSKRSGHKPSDLLWAAKHNLRRIEAELGPGSSIDPALMKLNVILAGPNSPEEIQQLAIKHITEAGIDIRKLRYDYVQAIEIMISLSADLNGGNTPFFQACVQWLGSWFGEKSVLSATLHLDENKPHMHVLISPVVNGQVNGSRLIKRENLKNQKSFFAKEVAKKFGVQLPESKLSKANQRLAVVQVLEHLALCKSPLMIDKAWPSIKLAITKDPQPFLADYGIHMVLETAKKNLRTSTQIFTSKGKGSQLQP